MDLTPQEWMSEIDNALHFREQFGREQKWQNLEDTFLNDPSGDAAIGPNLIFEMGDALLSALTIPEPEIVVEPQLLGGVKNAPIVEALDNQLISKLGLVNEIDLSLVHAYIYGRAILKIGYDSEYGFNPYFDVGKSNSPVGLTATQFDKKGNRIEYNDYKPGWPWVSAVMPHDIVVPWGTVWLQRAPWIAHRVIRLNEDIKKDPKYKNTDRLGPKINMEDFMASYGSIGAQKVRMRYEHSYTMLNNRKPAYNVLWEIRDMQDGRIKVVTEDSDKFLRDEPDVIQAACGVPFVSGTFVRHPRSFWSTPLAYYLGQTQESAKDNATQEEKQRRINNLRFLMARGTMSVEEAEKLVSGDVGAIGMVDAADIDRVVRPFPMASPIDYTIYENQYRSNARSITGFSLNQMGEYDRSTRRTAREAVIVAQGSSRRSGRRQGVVVDLYTGAIEKCNKLIFRYWTMPRVVKSEGSWTQITGPQIASDYSYSVYLVDKQVLSKAARLSRATMISQMMLNMGVKMDPQALMSYLERAAGDPALEELLSGGQALLQAPQVPERENENASV